MRKIVLSAMLAIAMSAAPTYADVIFMNFDTDINGDPIANGTLANTAYPYAEIEFSNNATILTGGGGVQSQPNFLAGQPFFTGAIDVDIVFPNIGNSVTAFNVTNSQFTLTAYDSANNVLGSDSCAFGAFPCSATVSFAGQIARVQITTSSQYGIDDLTVDFNAAVPEPLSLLLLGTGFAGYAVRRRRQR